jgi:hypothetical protein
VTITAISQSRLRDTEYCRYAPGQKIIQARVTFLGTPSGGETVQIDLVKEASGAIVATKTVALASVLNGSGRCDLTLDLTSECWDTRYLNRGDEQPDLHIFAARHGFYHLHLTILSAGVALCNADTPSFRITPVTAKELREKYLYGLTNVAAEALAPVVQPQLVTGITFSRVPPEFYRGQYTLAYNHTSHALTLTPAFPTPGFATPSVTLDPNGAGQLALATDTVAGDYVVIDYDGWDLPAADQSETLIFDGAQLLDDLLGQHISDAIGMLEGLLGFFLEPMRVTTDLTLDPLADMANGMPVMYEPPPSQTSWLGMNIPHRPLITVDTLRGQMNDGDVLDVPHEWHVINKVSGRVSLVPKNGTPINWILYGPAFIQFLYMGFPMIPDFWHYSVVAGVQDLGEGMYTILREMIARRAMISILTAMGRAYTGGVGSESYSKDGVSSNRAYTGSGAPIYGAEIEQHQQFITDNLSKMKQRVLGLVHVSFR